MAISPDHKFLFISLRSEPYSVSSFAIDPASGKLTLIKTSPLADNMAYVSTDRTGRYLFAASYAGSKSSINAISAAGEVDPTPLKVMTTGAKSHAIHVDPSNKFLFLNNLGDDIIYQYKFDADTGAIAPNSPPKVETPKGTGPRHFVFHPSRRFVFYVNELAGTVTTYRFDDKAGTLAAADSMSIVPADFKGGKPASADIHLTPDGKFLYASERTSSTLAAFSVNSETGKLTFIATYPAETQPRAFNIDPAGKYLLCVGTTSNAMSTFAIDPQTGALRNVSHRDLGRNPNWVEIISLPARP